MRIRDVFMAMMVSLLLQYGSAGAEPDRKCRNRPNRFSQIPWIHATSCQVECLRLWRTIVASVTMMIGLILTQRHEGVDVIARFLFPVLAVLGMAAPLGASPREAAPAYLSQHQTNGDDIRAIEKLLETYTTSVTNADQAAFEALLLNEEVPFSSTDELVTPRAGDQSIDTRRYQRFRKAVFDSGVRYTQRFYNVRIQQDGDLAQVSLDFITKETQSGRGGFGWKSLQLLKSQGHWKIASEIYTVRDLPSQQSGNAPAR
jgi:hypothetical protein